MARLLPSLARLLVGSCAFILLPALAAAQTPTGTISGRVADSNGGVIRGASVTIASPNLQGTQVQTTSDNGDYIFRALPPGLYTVTVHTTGFATAEVSVRVAPSETATTNVTLQPAGVTESVAVVADSTNFVNTVQAAANFNASLVNMLPTAKTMLSYVNLAPGVSATGPRGNFSIAGAMSFENLFLVNGAVVTDNVRSEPMDLFIEDALQDVTIATSGISAEYGRFSGGVVNAVTKSGGNMFSGSFRTEFNNDRWRAISPFDEPRVDKLNPIHFVTFGGPIRQDRLWFFGAGRFENRETGEETAETRIPYTFSFKEERYEGKLTAALSSSHRLQGSYLHINQEGANSNTAALQGGDVMDLRSLISRRDPQSLTTINYTGAMGSSIAFEAQYSGRRWTIKDAGGLNPDRVQGTPVFDQSTGNSYWAPGFCGLCDDVRNNDNVFLKASYFTSTGAGSHNVIAGYDTFNDRQKNDNRQSSTDYWLYATGANIVGTDLYPVVDMGTFIVHWPLDVASAGTNFRTHSLFVNDSWAVNRRLTVNLGLRFDANRGKNSSNQLVGDGSLLSPRLGLVFDPTGDGRTTINASYGRYAAALANSVANSSSSAGTPSILVYLYTGPTFNTDPSEPQVPVDQVLAGAFADFDANVADLNRPEDVYPLVQADLPGVATQIRDSLKSPYVDEFAVGIGRQIGSRGAVRVDFVDRTYGNFYAERVDQTTGTVANALGQEFDVILVENTNTLKRRYTGVTFLGTYRAGARADLGASYTLSKLRGNVDGENIGSGPVASSSLSRYPEYSEQQWAAPMGDLSADQRHRARVWGTFTMPVGGSADMVTLGVLQQLESGTPYGAAANIFLFDADGNPSVENPGYLNPPHTNGYFFTGRDAFRTAAMYRTDVSLNYRHQFGSAARGFELFTEFHILNVFNQFQPFNISGAQIDRTVLTDVNDVELGLRPFNPFTETPVRGEHWELGENFGKPVDADAYTLPRTFRFSAGLRF